MGKRVTFRRAREHFLAPASATGRMWNWGRVKFVEKTAGEVGDGKAWPLLVTLPQLMEIIYRIKDSEFSGAVTETWSGIVNAIGFSGTPTAELVSAAHTSEFYDWFVRRGYSAIDVTGAADFFGAAYSVDAGSLGGLAASGDYYDVGSDERALWIGGTAVKFNGASEWRTGFSHAFIGDGSPPDLDPLPSHYLAYHQLDGVYFGAEASLVFNGQVAWVDVAESGNPLDPANELYLGLEFRASDVAYVGNYNFSTNSVSASSTVSTGVEFELELSNSVVLACPIYVYTAGGGASYSGSIRCTATEWWPYATPVGLPAWDSDNGEAVNNVMDALLDGETFAALDLGMLSPQP